MRYVFVSVGCWIGALNGVDALSLSADETIMYSFAGATILVISQPSCCHLSVVAAREGQRFKCQRVGMVAGEVAL